MYQITIFRSGSGDCVSVHGKILDYTGVEGLILLQDAQGKPSPPLAAKQPQAPHQRSGLLSVNASRAVTSHTRSLDTALPLQARAGGPGAFLLRWALYSALEGIPSRAHVRSL